MCPDLQGGLYRPTLSAGTLLNANTSSKIGENFEFEANLKEEYICSNCLDTAAPARRGNRKLEAICQPIDGCQCNSEFRWDA